MSYIFLNSLRGLNDVSSGGFVYGKLENMPQLDNVDVAIVGLVLMK